ncbi:hypothetical protein EQP59_10600 [Ornithobacterium rhinotracheale]|uniref:NmrA-like domain-containing protein n=1 Tax=Ornithobacterium rhinotracheale TaxID=28251 RepID=A0A410JUQ1_ORNRH|nr:NmrA family NAD(P)-binding protein [Ornithobacterium rhinotracheale]QAR31758.1 hypothetical protein EQP59_10600 [Ornithobacterium rhinotracheale]
MSKNIMVTGASGGYGGYAIEFLKKIAPEANIYALVKDPKIVAPLKEKGFKVRVADYADLHTLTQAFEGIDRLLFVSIPVYEIQKNVVTAAKNIGVKYLAYTSIYAAEQQKLGLEINHRATEKLIAESGIPYVILRNSWYFNLFEGFVNMAKQSGHFWYSTGEHKITVALSRSGCKNHCTRHAHGNY